MEFPHGRGLLDSGCIDTKGRQLFSVPKDELGELFIKLLKKYTNKSSVYYLRARGRGSRKMKKSLFSNDVSLDQAQWIAFYVDRKWNKKR